MENWNWELVATKNLGNRKLKEFREGKSIWSNKKIQSDSDGGGESCVGLEYEFFTQIEV